MINSGSEPVNYNHLPEHSLLRGIVAFLLATAQARRGLPLHPSQQQEARPALSACLRILASDLTRPLPPLDWSNLEPLYEDNHIRSFFLGAVSTQAASSRSCRLFLERLLTPDQDRETCLLLVQNLSHLSAAVPPAQLQPFLQRCLQLSLQAELNGTGHDFIPMLDEVGAALEANGLPEGAVAGLAAVVESLHESIPADQEELYER